MAVARRGESNSYWLLRELSAGSRGVLQRLAWLERLARLQETPRQERLLDEEEEEAGDGREAFEDSSGGTLELA